MNEDEMDQIIDDTMGALSVRTQRLGVEEAIDFYELLAFSVQTTLGGLREDLKAMGG